MEPDTAVSSSNLQCNYFDFEVTEDILEYCFVCYGNMEELD